MPTVRDYEQAFQQDPSQEPPFLALRKVYREQREFDKLVSLYEERAQAVAEDAKAADLFYLAAELRADHFQDAAGAETDLLHALERYAEHNRSAERLKLLYRDQGRTNDYMTMLELEAAAIVKTGNAKTRAKLEAELGQLDAAYLARLEQAAAGPGKGPDGAQVLDEDALKLIESARKIYRALGDWPNVVRLYRLTLSATAAAMDGKRRADLMLALGKIFAEKMDRLPDAAEALAEVIRLAPNDERALELLAGIYARPDWTLPDGKTRAASLYFQLARRRHEGGDVDGALALLRKGMTAVPGHAESSGLSEQILYQGRRFKDLDRYYRERIAESAETEEKMDFLFKRAQLAERDLKDAAEALRVYEQIVSLEPPGGPASQHLASLYTGRQNFAKLADLREKQLAVIADPAARLPLLQELATLYKDRLGDPDQAAVYLHAILQIEPTDADALTAYADHFRRRQDWGALADLLEFSVEPALKKGTPVELLAERLEEIAVLAERNLDDTERALSAWRRAEEIMPAHERAREAQKRLLIKEKRWHGLADVLEREIARATDLDRKVDLLRRLARVFAEKAEDPNRAIAVYQRILAEVPNDGVAFRAIVELLEHGQRWQELATTIEGHLERVSRTEKIQLLRRLADLHEERLNAPDAAAWAMGEILNLLPGDRESFARLEALLERAGRGERLAAVLEQHVTYAPDQEKPLLLRRLGHLCGGDLADLGRASAHWEALLALVPGDDEALAALERAYERLDRASDLARVLAAKIERLGDDPAAQGDALRRLARLFLTSLSDRGRALVAWEALLRLVPHDAEALGALSELYREGGSWRKLERVLAERVALAQQHGESVALALERGRILEERLASPNEATAALEQLVTELDPRNLEAFHSLRRLAEAAADWPRVVSVAERQMLLREDAEDRLEAAMEIAVLQRDRLGDPEKAIASFERALAMAPDHEPALRALAPLYAMAGEADRLVATDQKLLVRVQDPAERRRLMLEIADACEEGLSDPKRAFEWTRRAWDESPDDETIGRLESLAVAHSLWEDLIRVYDASRARPTAPGTSPEEHAQIELDLAAKIAEICELRLQAPARAFQVLRASLASEPGGETLLPELERLAAAVSDWQGLLDVYARVGRGRPSIDDRIDLLGRRARVREEHLADPAGAMDEWLRAFGLSPEDPVAESEILRLGERTGRWEDALRVLAQRFARAVDADAKIEVAKAAAALVEDKVKDRVRAFRAYLNAFRLAPEDDEITGHLWRLAAVIDRYARSPRTPGPGVGDAVRDGPTQTLAVVEVGRSRPSADATIFLDLAEPGAAPVAVAQGVTEELDDAEDLELEDVEEMEDEAPGPRPAQKSAPPPPPGPAFESAWHEFAHAYALLPAHDNGTRRRYLRRIAQVWEKGAKEYDKALAALEHAFRLDPFDADVRADLERLAEERSEWERVCDVYISAVDGAMPTDQAVSLHHDVAGFHERLGQTDQAEARYQSVINLQPDDERALGRLEEIYREGQRWDDLASLLERRTGSLVDGLSDEHRRSKAVELSGLYEQRLDRPYEAIDTLERYLRLSDEHRAEQGDAPLDVQEHGELDGVLAMLARLYGRVEMWNKAVDVLRRRAELCAEPGQRRKLALEVAQILERELAQPARAADAYAAVLDENPHDAGALAALDRLYEALGQYQDLAAVLETRIALASSDERMALVKRRARVLEDRLANPDAAAAHLRSLGPEALEDDEICSSLLRNLKRAGLLDEAAKLLGQRIERIQKAGANPERIVALHVEVARLRLDEMDDNAGARESLEAALALDPANADALGLLGGLHLKANDFRSYARTRVREAEALRGMPGCVAAYLEAGRVYSDQLDDVVAARTCFEAAVDEGPEEPDALSALVGLLERQGELEEAKALLDEQLQRGVLSDPVARAAALTRKARLSWEKPGDADRVIPLLDEAHELAPDYLPALVTMADIYYRESAWGEAERRLTQALRRLRGKGETATLYFRLAEVYEKLGRLEDGYRQLQEASRALPTELLIKIAIGTNRFHARKWREAIGHLEGIEDHPDASRYPDEVARGLASAAAAHAKLKLGDRAKSLFEAALGFAPHEAMALGALAEIAIAEGDLGAGIDHLQKLADAADDRAARARLLERIGDLHRQRGNDDRARATYEAAVALIESPTRDQVPLFEKTLDLERAAGAVAEANETSSRLVGLIEDPKERGKKRREAAATLLEHGQAARAAELCEQALEEDPTDEAALWLLVEANGRAGRPEASRALLERLLPGLPEPAQKPAALSQRAALWEGLGRLRRGSDDAGAAAALERAVVMNPDRVSARLALGEIYDRDTARPDAALANHRALVAADVTREASVRIIARAFAAEGRSDGARCCLDVLDVLGLANDEDRAFLAAHPLRPQRPEEPYPGAIDDDLRRRHLCHPESVAMAEVFASLWGAGLEVEGPTLESLSVGADDKISPISDQDIAKVYAEVSKALDNKKAALYIGWDPRVTAPELALARPPSVVIPSRLATLGPIAEMRFRVGRMLELARPEFILAASIPPRAFAQLFGSVLKAFHPRHARRRAAASEAAAEQATRLKKSLPYKTSKRLVELFQDTGDLPFSSARWREVVDQTGNRAGLLVSADLACAARIVLGDHLGKPPADVGRDLLLEHATKDGPLRELLRFAVSEDYFVLRERLGTAVARAAAA
jgi:tetratricopeptide (TPR) repeat protein